MNPLIAASVQHGPQPHRTAKEEDRYYQAHGPRRRKRVPFIPFAVFIGIVALILDISSR